VTQPMVSKHWRKYRF